MIPRRWRGRNATAAVAYLAFLVACGSDGSTTASDPTTRTTDSPTAAAEPVIDPGDGGTYVPVIDPGSFTATVDNPYLPLLPGSRWVYEETGADGEVETITVEVLDERRTVMGVETIVVHDVARVDDEVIEDTYDWFAQDADGAVWYFGEDTTSSDNGVATTKGSWEAGVGGALPGIVMLADPVVSETGYRQEYLAGEAEDMGQVIAVGGSATTPAGSFTDVIVTRDWTPLEPDAVEEKSYAPGVGLVGETKNDGGAAELIEFDPPPTR